jgi:hypothetical protein
MDDKYWTEEAVTNMVGIGNSKMNEILEFACDPAIVKPKEHSKREVRERFIRAKYVSKAFVEIPGSKKCEAVWDSAEGGSTSVGEVEFAGFFMVMVKKGAQLKVSNVWM